jgi:hypothetical protein
LFHTVTRNLSVSLCVFVLRFIGNPLVRKN